MCLTHSQQEMCLFLYSQLLAFNVEVIQAAVKPPITSTTTMMCSSRCNPPAMFNGLHCPTCMPGAVMAGDRSSMDIRPLSLFPVHWPGSDVYDITSWSWAVNHPDQCQWIRWWNTFCVLPAAVDYGVDIQGLTDLPVTYMISHKNYWSPMWY